MCNPRKINKVYTKKNYLMGFMRVQKLGIAVLHVNGQILTYFVCSLEVVVMCLGGGGGGCLQPFFF